MKYLFSILLLIVGASQLLANGGGGTPGTFVSDCESANGFCTETNYNFPNNSSQGSGGSGYGDLNCLSTTPNPIWYYMQIDQPGQMNFHIHQETAGGSPIDVDYALWGPFPDLNTGCESISDNNIVDCSYSASADEDATIPNAQTGQTYIILITNYNGSAGNITFSQTGGAGSADCSVACGIQSATITPSACDPATNTYSLTGTITVVAPPTTGSAVFKTDCGDSVIVNGPFNSTITATIPNLPSNGASCTATFYFTDNVNCTETGTFTAPDACTPTCPITATSNAPICAEGDLKLFSDSTSGVTWTGPNGFTSNQANPIIPNATSTASGTYIATYTDPLCTSSASVAVTVQALPTISNTILSDTICSGEQPTINLSSDDSLATFAWASTTTPIINGTGALVSPTLTNDDTIPHVESFQATATVGNCVSHPTTFNITVGNIPVVTVAQDSIKVCLGTKITLAGQGTATSYAWTGGIQDSIPFVVDTTETYTVTGTNDVGCSSTAQVFVDYEDSVIALFTPDTLEGCVPTTITFTSTNDSTFSFVWDFGDGKVDDSSGHIATHTYTSADCYDVSLKVTSPLGCPGTLKLSDLICVHPIPEALFIASPSKLSLLNPSTHFINNSVNADYYLWNFDDSSSTTTVKDPDHTFPNQNAGNYLVTLYATSQYGCVDSMKSHISVIEDVIFYIPNAFTPDGDEYNNTLVPVFTSGIDPFDFIFRIYDRWGELIFESKDPSVGWDGTYLSTGKVAQEGTYVWTVEFKTKQSDERRKYNGHVTLIK